jgi:hypothetical protein
MGLEWHHEGRQPGRRCREPFPHASLDGGVLPSQEGSERKRCPAFSGSGEEEKVELGFPAAALATVEE